ncbi:MAG: hypothetical protein SFU25_09025 [Candidatus Caenarcaniphilales bacterium]|nr:hypothetical protein [Candidatus Caenarcaniphilales bacterium]
MNNYLRPLIDRINKVQIYSQELETLLMSNFSVIRIGQNNYSNFKFSFSNFFDRLKVILFNIYPYKSNNIQKLVKHVGSLDLLRKRARSLNLEFLHFQNELAGLEKYIENIEKQIKDIEKESMSRGLINFHHERTNQYKIDYVNKLDFESTPHLVQTAS